MKKSFYWSVALIAGLAIAGVYSTNVFAEDALPQEPEAPAVVEPTEPTEPVEPTEPTEPVEPTEPTEPVEPTEPAPEVQGASFVAPSHSSDDEEGDLDGDKVGDEKDNCPITPNEDQTDGDENGVGDVCEELTQGPSTSGLRTAFISLPNFPSNVDICHANNGNGWVSQSPSINSILKLNNGHNGHSGDIIPPFWYKIVIIPFYFPGKNWDAEGQAIHANGCEEPEPADEITLHAQKIVCDDESDLPNWGDHDPVTSINGDTASTWMYEYGSNLGCELVDWNFQWGYATQTGDPDDSLEDAGAGWNTFSGSAVIDVANENDIRVRESADAGYIGFTGQNTDQNVSAEVYCGSDVLHYDNWEWINDVVVGEDYYCVAWNVPLEKEEACRVQVVSDDTSIVVGPNVPAVEILAHPAWSALISAASWIWDAKDENGNPSGNGIKTFEKTFFHTGPVNSAVLDVASDNGFEVWINGVQVPGSAPEATDEFNYTSAGQNQYDVSGMSFVDGLNTLTVRVNDWGVVGGGLYKLVINAEEEKLCEEPPVDTTSDVTICKYQNSVSEQNGLSDWTVWLDEKTIVNDDTIVVDDSHDYSGETAENGCVTFKGVEFGDYTIGEDMPDGWQNVVDADGAVAAGSVVDVNDTTEIFNLVNTLSCNPEVNLIKNSGFENPVVVANGGGWEQFVNGTPLLEWVADFVDTTTDAPLEIQSGYSGWVGHDGSEQYAELDSTAPTTVSQDVPTTPGNTYRLTYWRAARPGTEPTNNANRALVDGVEVDSNVFASVGGNPDWYPSPVIEFTATNAVTNIAFKDDGSSADSLGTFIDDVGLYCIPPVEEHHNHVTICKAEVGHDGYLSGWTVGLNKYQGPQPEVEIVADTNEYEGVTGENGCITFDDVDLGQYLVNEVMQPGWEFFSGPTGLQNIDSDQGTYTFNIINRRIHGDDDDDDDNAPELTLAKSGIYDNETGTITFTLDWSVTGEGTIYDVVVTDPVPAGTNFVSADNWGFLSGSDVVWNLGDVTAPDSGSVSFTVSLDEVAAIGFYADGYSDNLQGTRKDASAINLDRTDPNIALGAPQSAGLSNDAPVVAGSFFALGFSEAPAVGGSIVLTFSTPVMNGAGNDLKVFEVTGGTYPDEVVQVEAWDIATAAWVNLGNVTRDGEVDLGSVLTTNQIRLTDVSTKALFPNDGDGYDVDALQAYYTVGSVCSVDNTATISGSEEGEVKKVAQTYDQDGYDFYASASTTVTVNEKACEPGDDDDDDDDDDDNGDDDDDFEEHIIVRKQVTEGSSTEGSFEFDPSWGENFSVAVNDQHDSGDLEPGWYSVSEVIPSGWGLDSSYCYSSEEQPKKLIYDDEVINPSEFYLSEGETVTCVFTNDQNDEPTGGDDTPNTNDTPRSSHRRSGSSNRGEVLGASTENNFCPFLRDYQHINMQNDPSEVNKAKAFFNSYLGLNLALDGIFDQSMFGAVVQFQNMFKQDVLDTWTEEYPGVLNDNATGYLYQTTKWKINSIICPGYETFPDKLIIAPGTTVN